MNAPDFWLDQTNAKKVSKQLSQLRDELDHIKNGKYKGEQKLIFFAEEI